MAKTKKKNRGTDAITRLTEKVHSPLVIRKVTKFGFPIYVGIITDDPLDELDTVIVDFVRANIGLWKSDKIQDKRDLAGMLAEEITERFERTEGVAVTLFIDKSVVSSLFGDFMNHAMCRQEYYFLLNMSTGV